VGSFRGESSTLWHQAKLHDLHRKVAKLAHRKMSTVVKLGKKRLSFCQYAVSRIGKTYSITFAPCQPFGFDRKVLLFWPSHLFYIKRPRAEPYQHLGRSWFFKTSIISRLPLIARYQTIVYCKVFESPLFKRKYEPSTSKHHLSRTHTGGTQHHLRLFSVTSQFILFLFF